MSYQIVAVGSVDGVLSASTALRVFPGSTVEFTQAFTVDKLLPENWTANDGVFFVDLPVNNAKDKKEDGTEIETGLQMTIAFVQRILDAGHSIIGVCDEHDATAWSRVFEATGINAEDLIIRPCSQKQGGFESSGALFACTFGRLLDQHSFQLCYNADEADHGVFTGKFAKIVNEAVKSDMYNDARRVYLAQHLSANSTPDEKILGWVKEYENILATHEELIAARDVFASGKIVGINASGAKVDMTTLMFQLYELENVKVVVVAGESFNKELKCKVLQYSFGTKDQSLDLLAALQTAGVKASGFAQKANVAPEDSGKAVEVLTALLG